MINFLDSLNDEYQTHNTNLGDIYIFENFVVTNFDEGVDVDFKTFYEVALLIKNYFKEKPFGYIANRSHSYSINLNDANLFNKEFPNLKVYALVIYNSLTERVFEIENHFFTYNRKAFKDLDYAINWVKENLS
ncbi:hypothetical protein [Winogradskyella bathintestinalis]|uniref:STAS/SEC14 domain-containing protein n=1 Tax=Winogradskyella bathintestinalis TaxID=3035208 RepID=A0ABT7ZW07_9FLAO|nr:hypothetical protein [Winogradskyella bathintestinalis]MDN3493202.1 hypothetical protein [Winogradskyella bathintestinalis]